MFFLCQQSVESEMPNDITEKNTRRQKSRSSISFSISLVKRREKQRLGELDTRKASRKRIESKIARLELNLMKEIEFDTDISISNAK